MDRGPLEEIAKGSAEARPSGAPENLIFALLPKRRLSRLSRYAITTSIVAAFVLLQLGLAPVNSRPFLLFTLPVFLVSLLFNRGSGFLATVLAAAAANFFFLNPTHDFIPQRSQDAFGTSLFAIVGVTIATLTESLRSALEKIATDERERTLLLKEINHRIRNDLQMVAALLTLGARQADSKEALRAATDRIGVVSEIYKILGNREDTPQLDGAELLDSLMASFRQRVMGVRPIAITASLQQVQVSTRCATALSLIVNELVTNALKHAFPDNRPGTIDVQLHAHRDVLELTVADDGVGSPAEPKPGLGSTLVHQLAAQHGGMVRRESRDGTRVSVLMPASCIRE